MSVKNPERVAKRLRWTGRIICLILTVIGGTILIGESVDEFVSQGSLATSAEGITLLLIGLVALAGCILSWWRDLPAGILLVVTSVGLGVHIAICAGRNHFFAWSVMGLPYLIAGVLLLYAWRLSRQSS